MKLKELPKVKKGRGSTKGFKYTQILKKREGYIYEVDTGHNTYYEIFESRQKEVKSPIEKRIHAGFTDYEVWPSDESFGRWAWTTKNKERAIDIYNSLSGNYK